MEQNSTYPIIILPISRYLYITFFQCILILNHYLQFGPSIYILSEAFFEILTDIFTSPQSIDEPLREWNTGSRVRISASISKEGT